MPNKLYDNDAEQSVLCAIMLDNSVLDDVRFKLEVNSFRNTSNRLIYAAMLELDNNNKPIDQITLSQALKINKNLDRIGGSYYLMQINDKIPTSANIKHHVKIVLDYAIARKLERICQTFQIFDGKMSIREHLSKFRQEVESLDFVDDGGMVPIGEIINEFDTEEAYNAMSKSCITTGCQLFDNNIIVKPADLIYIAGRPSMGKTAKMLDLAKRMAKHKERPGIVSIEMKKQYLAKRQAHSESMELGYQGYRQGAGKIASLPIFIDDRHRINLDYLNQQIGYNIRKYGLTTVFVDYLTLMDMPQGNNRTESVTKLSAGIKHTARKFNIPIFVLSQLSRDLEKRSSKRPQLSDLRESGAIEQDADIVIFVYRPFAYPINPDKAHYKKKYDIPDETELNFFLNCVAKQRDGALLDIKEFFNLNNQGFYEWDTYNQEPTSEGLF